MASTRSNKTSVQAHHYGVRRLEHALATGESLRMGMHGVRPATYASVGMVIAALGLAGNAVYGIIKPSPKVGNASVVIDSESGASYVVEDGRLHPAMNLASAMLAGSASQGDGPAKTARVNTKALGGMDRGPLLGIPGAPNSIADAKHQTPDVWAACDNVAAPAGAPHDYRSVARRTAYIGTNVTPLNAEADASLTGQDAATLVMPDAKNVYLVTHGGRIQRASPTGRRALEALGWQESDARPISAGLLNAIPERGTTTLEPVAEQGKAARIGTHDVKVGDVVRVDRTSTRQYYMVLHDGVQPVTSVQADLIHAATGQSGDSTVVSTAEISQQPVSKANIGLGGLPTAWPKLATFTDRPVLCLNWSIVNGKPRTTTLLGENDPSQAAHAVSVPPTAGDRDVNTVDRVYVPSGRALTVAVEPSETTARGPAYLINDQGIAYPLADQKALTALGLANSLEPGAAALIAMLPRGPMLEREAARHYFETDGTSAGTSSSTTPSSSPSSPSTSAPGQSLSPSRPPSSASKTPAPYPTSRRG